MNQVHEVFQHKFEQEAPPKQKYLQWETKFSAICNIMYKPRSGSPLKKTWHSEFVEEYVAMSLHNSTRKQHMEFDITRLTMQNDTGFDFHLS